MSCCHSPRPLIYKTRRSLTWVVRYRRCDSCGQTSKTIARVFVDQRNWLERVPDRRDSGSDDAIMASGDSRTKLETYDNERYRWFT